MINVYLGRRRMVIVGHGGKWICAVVTMLAQTCGAWTKDRTFVSKGGVSYTRIADRPGRAFRPLDLPGARALTTDVPTRHGSGHFQVEGKDPHD